MWPIVVHRPINLDGPNSSYKQAFDECKYYSVYVCVEAENFSSQVWSKSVGKYESYESLNVLQLTVMGAAIQVVEVSWRHKPNQTLI